ncbi:hypothetical protein [Sphingobacterium bambusae]|uniref:Lipoprotein n=1 Tax=Sphingobacterium bambusae TaxID=662858 RepID=A0ABW6BA43_9SPHI|nr:hypothetical protein [Sphingobacterium bambusae]WPL48577.1 hypothetical protein SCB77_21755 [Sphingobacterium bambusae]
MFNTIKTNPLPLLLCFFCAILFLRCDDEDEALQSDIKLSGSINGVKYIDRLPLFLPPGARRTPIIHVEKVEEPYLQFSSSLSPEHKENTQGDFSLFLRLPYDGSILIDQPYHLLPFDGQDKLTGIDRLLYLDSPGPFAAISSAKFNLDTTYYGTGTILFQEFDLETNKARGTLDISFPYTDSDRKPIKLSATFYCEIMFND